LKKKGFKEERVTTIGLDDIGNSTTLESNKSDLQNHQTSFPVNWLRALKRSVIADNGK